MSRMVKIVVYAPQSHAKKVLVALGEAGAGKIGNYTHCTFTSEGIGRFLPGAKAKPALGKRGKYTSVKEQRIETVCERRFIKNVISAVKKVHPYEEPALDIYPLEELH